MHPELRQLRHFVTVAEELHFGRAARRLHMTQPPLSQSIANLEELFEAPLFVRNRRMVGLTAAGAALLPEARRILEEAAALPELVRRAASGEAGRLALSFVSTAGLGMLPDVLRRYRTAYPAVRLVLQEATSYLKIVDEPLVLCAPSGLAALEKPGPVRLRDLPPLPLVIFPRAVAPSLHDAILACFRAAGVLPTIGQEAIQMQTIVSLVSGGMGLALVPQSVSNLMRPGVEYRALIDPAPLAETGLAWRRDNDSPVLRGFLECLKN
jgi:DNA-binding transcriptional LysR family regulator